MALYNDYMGYICSIYVLLVTVLYLFYNIFVLFLFQVIIFICISYKAIEGSLTFLFLDFFLNYRMWGGTGANLKAYIKHIPNTS